MNDAELLKVLFKKMLSWSKRDMKQLMIFRREFIYNKHNQERSRSMV